MTLRNLAKDLRQIHNPRLITPFTFYKKYFENRLNYLVTIEVCYKLGDINPPLLTDLHNYWEPPYTELHCWSCLLILLTCLAR